MRLLTLLDSPTCRRAFRITSVAILVCAMANAANARGKGSLGPEIDPGAIGSAITLLLGGSMLLTSRSKRK